MSEERNHYGIPMPPSSDRDDDWWHRFCDRLAAKGQDLQPQDYAHGESDLGDDPHDPGPVPASLADPLEAESWRDELTPAEQLVYDEVQRRVARACGHAFDAADLVWIVEETLWQLGSIADNAAAFHLPGTRGRVASFREPGR